MNALRSRIRADAICRSRGLAALMRTPPPLSAVVVQHPQDHTMNAPLPALGGLARFFTEIEPRVDKPQDKVPEIYDSCGYIGHAWKPLSDYPAIRRCEKCGVHMGPVGEFHRMVAAEARAETDLVNLVNRDLAPSSAPAPAPTWREGLLLLGCALGSTLLVLSVAYGLLCLFQGR